MSVNRWGRAWDDMVEGQFTDTDQRSPGRTLARRNGEALVIEPGRAEMRLDDRAAGPVTADLSFAGLADDIWSRLVIDLTESASGMAQVLTGGWPPGLAGMLIPDTGELSLTCSCEVWSDPCRHGWALLTALGSAIAADPQVLLVLRGRSRSELVHELRGIDSAERRLVSADDAFARIPGPLPRPLSLPWRPGRPPELGANPPPDSGVDLSDLRSLAADAAARATALLSQDGDSGLYDTVDADLVRRAAEILRPGGRVALEGAWERLVAAAETSSEELEARARAWMVGGSPGLAAHTERQPVSSDAIEAALSALGGGHRLPDGAQLRGVQLRCTPTGLWWRFVADDRLGWVLEAGGFDDPGEALDPTGGTPD